MENCKIMAKFILDIKEGKTDCDKCPFVAYDTGEATCCMPDGFINCDLYDLSTMSNTHKIEE